MDEDAAANWFAKYWTGTVNGRWLLAPFKYGQMSNNNSIECHHAARRKMGELEGAALARLPPVKSYKTSKVNELICMMGLY